MEANTRNSMKDKIYRLKKHKQKCIKEYQARIEKHKKEFPTDKNNPEYQLNISMEAYYHGGYDALTELIAEK